MGNLGGGRSFSGGKRIFPAAGKFFPPENLLPTAEEFNFPGLNQQILHAKKAV